MPLPPGTSYFTDAREKESTRPGGLFGAPRTRSVTWAVRSPPSPGRRLLAVKQIRMSSQHSLTRVVVGGGGSGDGSGDGGVRVDLLGGGGAEAGHEKHQKLHVAAVAVRRRSVSGGQSERTWGRGEGFALA